MGVVEEDTVEGEEDMVVAAETVIKASLTIGAVNLRLSSIPVTVWPDQRKMALTYFGLEMKMIVWWQFICSIHS